ncbi:DNA polymerase thumb domain-containing protein [Streptomyces sp. NPDC090231]|uniref:DNA polymerase Y family protein n=1 Tax=unclassified Streptomyces TaxID=2593676 RepID=UPI002E0E2CF4
MNTMTTRARSILRIQLHDLGPTGQETYEQALALLRDLTPLVQALPPDAADLDVTGALRFFDRDTHGLAAMAALRLAAHLGLRATIGAGPNRMLAAMAADTTAPGHVTVVAPDPEAIAAFLHPKPVATLYGVGPATARTLKEYGLHRIGDLLDTPLQTLQRILGKTTAVTLSQRARGLDTRPVTTEAAPKSTGCSYEFSHDELDPTAHRRALLDLCERLGLRLRTTAQVAARLALSISYADGTTTQRSRTLEEYTAHTPALRTAAYDLYTRLGLQRARVRTITVRADLTDTQNAVQQLLLDPADDKRRRIEQAADRARARFGDQAIRPSALAQQR